MSRLAIVWHSRTGVSEALAQAAFAGAQGRADLIAAEAAEPERLLAAGGYLFVCPENLGSMSGAMKDMFDRCYYPLLGQIEGRAYATIIAAGSDGRGAQAQLDRIVTGWRLRRVAEPFIAMMDAQKPDAILAQKHPSEELLRRAEALGAVLAEGLSQGIF